MNTPAHPATAVADPADAVAAAVLAVPAVVALHPGGLRHRAVTYLPGRRVEGVHLDGDRVTVSVVGTLGVPVALLADQVRSAVAPLAGGRPINVHVADLQPLADQLPALPAAPPA